MAKGLIGGMTDYSHQSFNDILVDLIAEKNRTIEFRNRIQSCIDELEANNYWKSVPVDFKLIIAYSIRHFNTAITEFEEIINDLQIEVKPHHILRLQRISNVAGKINVDIGKVWHQKYLRKDYSNDNFRIVEEIYSGTRDMAVNLLDTSNIAERLKDFIGKTGIKMKNNPWISGSFYLFIAVIVVTGLAVLSNRIHWTLLPVVLIGSILIIMTIGILQLRNDDKISDKSFQSLVIETYKGLPLLKRNKNKDEKNN